MNVAAQRSTSDPPADCRELIQRIASSKTFHRSPRIRDLFLDIAENTLAGRGDALSEQSIGVRVFGRDADYNPADDNIVRASVRQVRLKLKEYFETEGQAELFAVEIPKGNYVAVFTARPAATAPEPLPESAVATQPVSWRRWSVWIGIGPALLVAIAWWVTDHLNNRPRSEAPTMFTALLARNNDPVHMVLTDSALVVMNEVTKELPTLDDYVSRKHVENGRAGLGPEADRLWTFIASRQITSLADVLILSRLYQQDPGDAKRLDVRYSRHMQPRDFKLGNFIITGSPRSNPWTTLFDASLNFRFDFVSRSIRNTAPVNNEPEAYQAKTEGLDYARIALLHNLSGSGFVLLIAGLNAEGTEGAGEFLLRGDSLQQVRKALSLGEDDPIPLCEFVLEVKTIQGTARSETIVAARRQAAAQ